MATANIITCPPIYEDLVMVTPAQSTLIYGEIPEATLATYNESGCKIKVITVPDSFTGTEPTVAINSTPISVTTSGGNFTWENTEDQTQDIDITLDNGSGATVATTYTYYDPYLYLIGNAAIIDFYSNNGGAAVDKLSGIDGSNIWTKNTTAAQSPAVFYASGNGEFFAASLVAGAFYGAYIDVDGTVTASFSFAQPGGVWGSAIAFDPVTEYFHVFLRPYPDPYHQTRYIYSKAGVLVNTIVTAMWPFTTPAGQRKWACAYNGDFYFAGLSHVGELTNVYAIRKNDPNDVIYSYSSDYGDDVILKMSYAGDYIYALFSPSVVPTRLLKISTAGVLAWEYIFDSNYFIDTDESSGSDTFLSVNNNGVCIVYLYSSVDPWQSSLMIDSDGVLVWEKPGEWLNCPENDRSYYGAGA